MPIPVFLENLDPTDNFKKYLTPRAVMDSLKPTSICHDIVGLVNSVEIRYVAGNKRVMNFAIKIEDNSLWPMSAWDDDIERFEEAVIVNYVIHIDQIYVKFVDSNSRFSMGHSIGFSCQSNTIITNLNKCNPIQKLGQSVLSNEGITVFEDIQLCVNEKYLDSSKIGLVGYVKTPFVQGNPNYSLRMGVLTDGKIKITTRIKNYNDSGVVFKAGQKLKVYGYLTEEKNKIYLEMIDLKDIYILEDEECSSEMLRKVMNTPQKPGNDHGRSLDSNKVSKKLRLDDN